MYAMAIISLVLAAAVCALPSEAASSDTQRWATTVFGKHSGDLPGVGFFPSGSPPFSFVYGGRPSSELLPTWSRTARTVQKPDRTLTTVRWTDPATSLTVLAEVTAFKDFPAVEWVLRFENGGHADTPILSNIRALSTGVRVPAGRSLALDQINGDTTDQNSFIPLERTVPPGQDVVLMPSEGRPSTGTFPFFDIQSGDEGFFVAIGWTGRWAASLAWQGADTVHLQAGMERTHLLLHPGEAIRTPRVLLLKWSGDRLDAHNTFRRLLLAHYYPRLHGRPIQLAVGAQTFNRWFGGARPNWGTEQGQLDAVRINRAMGSDTLWMDAGWFVGSFPNGVGNWLPRPKDFPRGMKPIGDACHEAGLRFLMWYEPERVAPGSEIARERPSFVLGGAAGGLFNLGDPEARRWMTDLLSRQIHEYRLSCWRSDFNMDPLPYWRAADAPDRQGITEIRYVEGLYQMWDELRARRPGLMIDNCASGGRRIDLETVMRSVVQTRSDTACAPGRAEWDQSQTYGLSLYLPLHATFTWETTPYDIRSTATAGFLSEWDILDPAFPVDAVKPSIAEAKANREYWYGDYYPLTPWSLAPDRWIAWQLHLPEKNAGIVLAFRRAEAQDASLGVQLRAIDPARTYSVTLVGDDHVAHTTTQTGRQLQETVLRVEKPRGSLLLRYHAQ